LAVVDHRLPRGPVGADDLVRARPSRASTAGADIFPSIQTARPRPPGIQHGILGSPPGRSTR
jgi:hypothetical protein